MSKQSMRQIAAELEISPAYLSYMLNGKRPWRKDLYQRYMGVVNTFVNSEVESVNKQTERPPRLTASLGSEKVGAGRGTRTHTAVKPADFKSSADASVGTNNIRSNEDLVSSFVNERRERGLSVNTCRFYEGHMGHLYGYRRGDRVTIISGRCKSRSGVVESEFYQDG